MCAAIACARSNRAQVVAVDLVRLLDRAERRPPAGVFDRVEFSCQGRSQPAVSVPAASRLTWTLRFPAHATFIAAAAIEGSPDAVVEFRVGVSDDRIYETLLTRTVAAGECRQGWIDLQADLSLYGGRQWSVFYRPDERDWKLILGVSTTVGTVQRAFWGAPRIEADADAARRHLHRNRS